MTYEERFKIMKRDTRLPWRDRRQTYLMVKNHIIDMNESVDKFVKEFMEHRSSVKKEDLEYVIKNVLEDSKEEH